MATRTRPMKILDLFCGAGGASVVYHQGAPDAQIVGIDWTRDAHQIREAIPPAYTRYIIETIR